MKTIENATENIINTYCVKYFTINKNKKEFIKNKLKDISLKYSKKGIIYENISDIDKLIYLK